MRRMLQMEVMGGLVHRGAASSEGLSLTLMKSSVLVNAIKATYLWRRVRAMPSTSDSMEK
jgi:hypothetical protein